MADFEKKSMIYNRFSLGELVTISLVAVCGIYAMWEGISLDLGSVRRIGAGAFPFGLGALLLIMSIFLAVTNLGAANDEASSAEPTKISFRGLIHISAALLAFMVLITPLGLAPTIAIVTILSATADRSLKPRSIFLLALFSSCLCTVVFVFLLGLPLQPFWW